MSISDFAEACHGATIERLAVAHPEGEVGQAVVVGPIVEQTNLERVILERDKDVATEMGLEVTIVGANGAGNGARVELRVKRDIGRRDFVREDFHGYLMLQKQMMVRTK